MNNWYIFCCHTIINNYNVHNVQYWCMEYSSTMTYCVWRYECDHVRRNARKHIYIYTYIYIYIYIYIQVCYKLSICIPLYIYKYVCKYVCIYACIIVYIKTSEVNHLLHLIWTKFLDRWSNSIIRLSSKCGLIYRYIDIKPYVVYY